MAFFIMSFIVSSAATNGRKISLRQVDAASTVEKLHRDPRQKANPAHRRGKNRDQITCVKKRCPFPRLAKSVHKIDRRHVI
jgi:hypothetical protein